MANIIKKVITGGNLIVLLVTGGFLSVFSGTLIVQETSGFFWVNLAYLVGLLGNGLILFLLFYFKKFNMNKDLRSGVNWIIGISFLGYAGVNLTYFAFLVIGILISTIVTFIEHLAGSGYTPADWLEDKFK